MSKILLPVGQLANFWAIRVIKLNTIVVPAIYIDTGTKRTRWLSITVLAILVVFQTSFYSIRIFNKVDNSRTISTITCFFSPICQFNWICSCPINEFIAFWRLFVILCVIIMLIIKFSIDFCFRRLGKQSKIWSCPMHCSFKSCWSIFW